MIYPCKFGEISPVGSRDNSHSWVLKWDADGIRSETSMFPLPAGGGGGGAQKTVKLLVLFFIIISQNLIEI